METKVPSFFFLKQGYTTYGPKAKSGPRSHFIRSQRHFVNNEKI